MSPISRLRKHCTHRAGAFVASLGALMVLLTPVQAAVVSTSGAIVATDAPATVVDGSNENDTAMLVFAERAGILLEAPLNVLLSGGSAAMVLGAWSPEGVIPGGTRVDSYFVHADRSGPVSATMQGTITFDTDILGMIVRGTSLNDSDAVFGAAGTTYGTNATRGLEGFEDPLDYLTVSPDRRTLNLSLRFATADQLRIITVAAPVPDVGAVPLPAAAWLMLPATLFVFVRGRRDRQRRDG